MELSKYLAKPEETLAEHTAYVEQNAKTLYELGYIEEEVYQLLITACHFHDYGKMNPEFQKRVKAKSLRFDPRREIGHNILSVFFLNKEDFEDSDDYLMVAAAVLNHHHYCCNSNVLLNRDQRALVKKLLEGFCFFPVKNRTVGAMEDIRSDRKAILIQGLLLKCDYSASAHLPIEYKNDFLSSALQRLMAKWQKKTPAIHWNELQEFCRTHQEENLVVTAPTGMGKTEAALWWLGDHKGFYVLPLKTAINGIYDRICHEILEDEEREKRLALLHSDSIGYLLGQCQSREESDWDIVDYKEKSKRLTLPLSVTTPDQIFDFVFKYPGYELKLATLSYSRVIIDEIQAYSADLLAYIICGLKQIDAVGGRFAVLTATLPPFIRDLLGDNRDMPEIQNPVNDTISFKEAVFLNDSKRHHLKVLDEELTVSSVLEVFEENEEKAKSNKILVVCNTIKKAQGIYEGLKNGGLDSVYLLHSKFIREDRSKKEEQLLSDGQTFAENGELYAKTVIWVTTQIVEASLDIDFDYLLTELSDLNSLLQRLGRCNRRGLKSIGEINCRVFLQIDPHLLTKEDHRGGFIDRGLHEISKDALWGFSGVLTEQRKLELIEEYLTKEKLTEYGSCILRDFRSHYRYINGLYIEENNGAEVERRFRNILSYDVIPKEVYLQNQERLTEIAAALQDSLDYKQRIRLQNEVKKFTVPVGYFDLGGEKKQAVCRELADNGKITLNRFTDIYIVDCHYNSEIGFVRLSKSELSPQKKESDQGWDSFI